MHKIIIDTLEDILYIINLKSVEVSVEIDKECNITLINQIYSDKQKIQQLLLNFITNALENCDIGGAILIKLEIT